MYFLYNVTLIILALILSPIIMFLFALKAKLRAGFFEKIGFYGKKRLKDKSIWIHAVSVGEVNAIENFFKRLKQEFPEYKLVLTTVTRTGQAVANAKLSQYADIIAYFPYDFAFSVNFAIKAFNPALAIVAETEIWPMFSHKISKNNIPLMIVNGRISPNSHKGYKKAKFFFREIFKNYRLILTQSDGDKDRIIDIGANLDITKTMGNLKFDIKSPLDAEQLISLKNSLYLENQQVLIAGSTHKGEDEIVLASYSSLKKEYPDLKLLLAPRHPERHSQVFKLVEESGFSYGSRKASNTFKDKDIIVIDTMGELGKMYALATISFIGGSFSGTGGHNPLESAIFGIPVVSGPTVFNFKDIYKLMIQNKSALIAEDEKKLTEIISDLLKDKELYQNSSKACLEIFEKNQGALDVAINYTRDLLSE
ncbi:MAG: 3-deoxy-D-manno-octulosonic acid transferase [bacterium]